MTKLEIQLWWEAIQRVRDGFRRLDVDRLSFFDGWSLELCLSEE